MNKHEKAVYAAGYFDGDGTITLLRQYEGYLYLRIAVVSGDSGSLAIFSELFGGDVATEKHKNVNRPLFAWRMNGRHAQAALKILYPFLIAKRTKAKAALGLIFTRHNSVPVPKKEAAKREIARSLPGYETSDNSGEKHE
jgi:hypothetical protein